MTEQAKFTVSDAGAAFFRWEKLRIPYNLIVGVVGFVGVIVPWILWLLGEPDAPDPAVSFRRAAIGVVLYGVMANVCYCAGPVVECYLRWLGLRAPRLTAVLFIIGTAFSVLLTGFIGLVAWAVVLFPGFD